MPVARADGRYADPMASDEEFLGDLNEAMRDRPLDLTRADDRQLYVPVYDQMPPEEDPVKLLANQIRRSRRSSTAHLFSGYKGSGKSTELRRLQTSLREAGYAVFYLDLETYLDLYTPVGITDYLLDVAGAFDDTLREADSPLLHLDGPTLWERASGWLRSWEFAVDEFSTEVGVDAGVKATAALKLSLKENPVFRRRLSEHLSHRLEVVVKEIHAFVGERARAVAEQGSWSGVVLLVDSTEKLDDTDSSGERVKASVRTLFAQHARRLRFPGVHAVYSIPPDLQIREPQALATNYDGAVLSLTAVTVERRVASGHEPYAAGIELLVDVLCRRHAEIGRLFASPQTMEDLVRSSGGNLRNWLSLVRGDISRTFTVPASDRAVHGAFKQLAAELKWLTTEEKAWLAPLLASGQPRLEDDSDRVRFAEFLDRQVVLPYRNGEDWFDLAPPVRERLG